MPFGGIPSILLNIRPEPPKGNMIVFSAAQGNETAYPYDKHRHGMFTYYLLKKLQESKGDVTMSELRDYVVKNVTQQSVVENNKMQTPSVTPAPVVKDTWESWKL